MKATILFEDLKECLVSSWNEMVGYLVDKYEVISQLPFFKLIKASFERTYHVVVDIVNKYNLRKHPEMRRLVQNILVQVDAVASSVVRFVEVVIMQSRKLMEYQISYQPDKGHFQYQQVRFPQF